MATTTKNRRVSKTSKSTKSIHKEIITCVNCGKRFNGSDFYTSKREEYAGTGKCPICKYCLVNMIIDENGIVTESGFKKVLSYLDIPFFPDSFAKVSESAKIKNIIGDYKKRLNTRKEYKESDLRYADSVRFESEHKVMLQAERDYEQDESLKVFWGEGYTATEYKFLQNAYDRLVEADEGDMDFVKEINYQNLAILQLTNKKCLAEGNTKGAKESMDSISRICGDCDIKPTQRKESHSNSGAFSIFIKKIEDEDPIPRWEEDLGKIDKLKKLLTIFFFGNLARALEIHNPMEDEFENEMAKYTVDIDEDIESWDDIDG